MFEELGGIKRLFSVTEELKVIFEVFTCQIVVVVVVVVGTLSAMSSVKEQQV